MGNVAGVGQLLEAVGIPAAQVGTQPGSENTGPGQDFATVLQQAGGPGAQDRTVAVSEQQDLQTVPTSNLGTASGAASASAGATRSAKNAVGAQRGSVKAAEIGKPETNGQPGLQSAVAGQPQGITQRVTLGTTVGVPNAKGSKQDQATAAEPDENPVPASPLKPVAITGAVPAMSLSGTAKGQSVAVTAPLAAQAASAASGVSLATLKGTSVSATNLKIGAEATAETIKPAVKAAVSAINSKLPVLVEPGTTQTTQSTEFVAVTTPSVTVAPPPVAANSGSAANDVGKTGLQGALDLPAAIRSPATPVRVRGVEARNGNQSSKAEASSTKDAASEGTAFSAAAAVKTGPAQDTFAVVAPSAIPVTTAGLATPMPASVEPVAKSVAKAQEVSALPSKPEAAVSRAVTNAPLAAAAGSLEQASAGFQAAIQTAGTAETSASKPALHNGRATVAATVKAGDATAASGANPVDAPAAAVKTPGASVMPTAVSAMTTGLAPVAVAESKAEVKNGEALESARSAPAAVKTTAPAAASPAPMALAKETEEVSHATVSAQPAAATAGSASLVTASVPLPMAHEVSAGAATVSATTGIAALSSGSSVVVGTHETSFGTGLSHTTLSTTPTSLEVGVASGTHGWLKIRAELNAAGEVNASLTGATPAAAEKLRSELPSLSNYLQGEKVVMGTLDVRAALHTAVTVGEGGATFSQTGSGQGGSPQGNTTGAAVSADAGSAGGRAQQQASQGGDAIPVVNGVGAVDEVVLGRATDAASYGSLMELGDNAAASSVGYGTGGGWLNVRA